MRSGIPLKDVSNIKSVLVGLAGYPISSSGFPLEFTPHFVVTSVVHHEWLTMNGTTVNPYADTGRE